MLRAKIIGIGSYVPERIVTNDELRFLDDQHVRQDTPRIETSDEWIRTRTGIEERRYVPNDGKWGASDVALPAAKRALEDAGLEAKDVDCIIFATLSPDIHFPGSAVFLQTKLGIDGENGCACYDIRQQCSGFVYGMQMADAFIRTGMYKHVLLVGAEVHSHSLDFSTRGRDVTVLFGDGAGAVVIAADDNAGERDGILYTKVGADGSGAWDLYLKVFEIAHLPYVWYDASTRQEPNVLYPQMQGKKVFLNAVRAMNLSTREAMQKTGLTWKDVDWFVPHQANLRIIEATAKRLEMPMDRVVVTVDRHGNTSSGSVPLALDEAVRSGRVQRGQLLLLEAFGGGFTWGSALLRY